MAGLFGRNPVVNRALALTAKANDVPAINVSPKPGTGGAEEAPSFAFHQPYGGSFSQGESQPEPFPLQRGYHGNVDYDRLADHSHQLLQSSSFKKYLNDYHGVNGAKVVRSVGSLEGNREPSFTIHGGNLTSNKASGLAKALGFGFMRDAVVHTHPHAGDYDADVIPTILVGQKSQLRPDQLDRLHKSASSRGLDYSLTPDLKAAKFLHFGSEEEAPAFADKIEAIAREAGLPNLDYLHTKGKLTYAKDYLNEGLAGNRGVAGQEDGSKGPSLLFRGTVNHVLAPYARAIAQEGYRLHPERFQTYHGLDDEHTDLVRRALMPGQSRSQILGRSTVPLMSGTETLPIDPTGYKGRPSTNDAIYALSNRSAAQGTISPNDYSDEAKNTIAKTITDEVDHHIKTSNKSAIGWYDAALGRAKDNYHGMFPELKTSKKANILFNSLLGITSQGLDVHANSRHAVRLYHLLTREGKDMPAAVEQLKGTFGDKTRAIENNLLKFHSLTEKHGVEETAKRLDKKMTVSQWNQAFRNDPKLRGLKGETLPEVDGTPDQKVSGWSTFGPKIGSFINNLNGDYSTLTADLWYSRTWNRLLGHSFAYSPEKENKQYHDMRDALAAEYHHNNPEAGPNPVPYKVSSGIPDYPEKQTAGSKKAKPVGTAGDYYYKGMSDPQGSQKYEPWEHGSSTKGMSKEYYDELMNDPEALKDYSVQLEGEYRKGQYKDKSDLKRRAKNWVENNADSLAAPRTTNERGFQQKTVETAQKMLARRGHKLTIADIQAALWFHEKDLLQNLGISSKKSAPADYGDAAQTTAQMYRDGTLFDPKHKIITKRRGGLVLQAFKRGGIAKNIERALSLTSLYALGHDRDAG
jgi:hypothetical protein